MEIGKLRPKFINTVLNQVNENQLGFRICKDTPLKALLVFFVAQHSGNLWRDCCQFIIFQLEQCCIWEFYNNIKKTKVTGNLILL